MRRNLIFILSIVLFASLLPVMDAAHAARKPQVHVVTIDKVSFGAVPGNLVAGDIIEWVNRDPVEHSATAEDGSFDVDLAPGAKGRTVVKAGTFAFFCKFHPTMTGTLVVKPK